MAAWQEAQEVAIAPQLERCGALELGAERLEAELAALKTQLGSALEESLCGLKAEFSTKLAGVGAQQKEGFLAHPGEPIVGLRSAGSDSQWLQEEPEATGLAVSAPASSGYEFQSHGVVEMLEKLLDKFIDERTTWEKEELNSKHAHVGAGPHGADRSGHAGP